MMLPAIALIGVSLLMGSPSNAADPLSDVEIAHAAYTADELDIAYAKIALEKSKTPAIREFAELMVKDHTAANEAALALVKKLGVTPKDNAFSQTLAKNGEAKKAELRGLSGAAFDRAYAQNELAYHQVVVKTVAEQWIPTIQNAEFKQVRTGANEIFKVHQAHAQHMVDGLKTAARD
jgi:putative membrane protein